MVWSLPGNCISDPVPWRLLLQEVGEEVEVDAIDEDIESQVMVSTLLEADIHKIFQLFRLVVFYDPAVYVSNFANWFERQTADRIIVDSFGPSFTYCGNFYQCQAFVGPFPRRPLLRNQHVRSTFTLLGFQMLRTVGPDQPGGASGRCYDQ